MFTSTVLIQAGKTYSLITPDRRQMCILQKSLDAEDHLLHLFA